MGVAQGAILQRANSVLAGRLVCRLHLAQQLLGLPDMDLAVEQAEDVAGDGIHRADARDGVGG